MTSVPYPVVSHTARVFALFALRNVSEEPINHLIKITEDGGFDGSSPLTGFYGQLLLGIKPEVANLSDEEAAAELAEFKRQLKVEALPGGDLDILEVYCHDIKAGETHETNPRLKELREWLMVALEEAESQNQVGAGWVHPSSVIQS